MSSLKTLIAAVSDALLDSWHRGGFRKGPTISVLKSAMQKAYRQFTNGVDKTLDQDCKFLAVQCFVSAGALIQHLVTHAGRASDAKALYTNIWNRLIVMAINEDTVDINGLFCLHSILMDYEASHDINNFDPVAYVHATYRAWYCLAKTEKCRLTSWIAPLFTQADYEQNPSYCHLQSYLFVPSFDAQVMQDAYAGNDFQIFLAQLLRYDALHFDADATEAQKKKAKGKWIDDLLVGKLGMTAEEAAMVAALMKRKDENDRMRLHLAVMLFYRRNGILADQVGDYRTLLAHPKTFNETSLCNVLEKTIADGRLTVGRVQFVYDQHTGNSIRDQNGTVIPFAEAGAYVNHPAPPLSQLLEPLEQAYIQRSRNVTLAKSNKRKSNTTASVAKKVKTQSPVAQPVAAQPVAAQPVAAQPVAAQPVASSQVYKLERVVEILGFKPNPVALIVTFQGVSGEYFVKLGGSAQEQMTAADLSHKMSRFGLYQPQGVTADIQMQVDSEFHSKVASFVQTLTSDPSRARELKWITRLVTLKGPLHPTSTGSYPMLLMPRIIGATKLCDMPSTFWTTASVDRVAEFVKVLIARRVLMITDTNCFNITFLEASGDFFSTDHNAIKNDKQMAIFQSFTLKTAQSFKAELINMVSRCSAEPAFVDSLIDFCGAILSSKDLPPSSQPFLLRLHDFLKKEMCFPADELLK